MSSRLDRLPARTLDGGLQVHEARSLRSRLLGLMFLDRLHGDRALHIPRCSSVHTIGMRFPLDLVWLDKHGSVLRVDRGVPPWRFKACRKARDVVECAAGRADAFIASGLGARRSDGAP